MNYCHYFSNNLLGTPIIIFFDYNFCVIHNDISVFPTPHINANIPLSLFLKYSIVLLIIII